jgi:hypothetical protein
MNRASAQRQRAWPSRGRAPDLRGVRPVPAPSGEVWHRAYLTCYCRPAPRAALFDAEGDLDQLDDPLDVLCGKDCIVGPCFHRGEPGIDLLDPPFLGVEVILDTPETVWQGALERPPT